MKHFAALILTPVALIAAACMSHRDDHPVTTSAEACETVKRAVSRARRFDIALIAGCDVIEAQDEPRFFIMRLNGFCHETVCGSVLMGWFALEKSTGRVFDWNVGEWSVGEEIMSRG